MKAPLVKRNIVPQDASLMGRGEKEAMTSCEIHASTILSPRVILSTEAIVSLFQSYCRNAAVNQTAMRSIWRTKQSHHSPRSLMPHLGSSPMVHIVDLLHADASAELAMTLARYLAPIITSFRHGVGSASLRSFDARAMASRWRGGRCARKSLFTYAACAHVAK